LLVFQSRADAAAAVRAFQSKGYGIAYITTRAPGFQSSLPAWLEKNDFPAGNLHVAQNDTERKHAADFKAGVLNSYIAHGWRLSYAFGDSPTDFIAYQRAGLPRERVFALKRKWRDSCEEGVYSACLDGWSVFLQTFTIEPAVAK
jgi:phosphatidate phosphatase PAH1